MDHPWSSQLALMQSELLLMSTAQSMQPNQSLLWLPGSVQASGGGDRSGDVVNDGVAQLTASGCSRNAITTASLVDNTIGTDTGKTGDGNSNAKPGARPKGKDDAASMAAKLKQQQAPKRGHRQLVAKATKNSGIAPNDEDLDVVVEGRSVADQQQEDGTGGTERQQHSSPGNETKKRKKNKIKDRSKSKRKKTLVHNESCAKDKAEETAMDQGKEAEVHPVKNDVLVGTRVASYERKDHYGNIYFQKLISNRLGEYQSVDVKKTVVRGIIQSVHEQDGRFLEKLEDGEWAAITNDRRLCNIIVNRFNEQYRIEQSAGLSCHAVLIARGMKCNDHPGNRALARLVEEHYPAYHEATKAVQRNHETSSSKEKKSIVHNVIKSVKSRGGGFLEKVGKDWIPIHDNARLEDIIESKFNRYHASSGTKYQLHDMDSTSGDHDTTTSRLSNAELKDGISGVAFRNSVLMAVGKTFNEHPGNILLKSLIECRVQSFLSAACRKDVIRDVIKSVTSRGGHFLEKKRTTVASISGGEDDSDDGEWVPIDQISRIERNIESRFYYAIQHPSAVAAATAANANVGAMSGGDEGRFLVDVGRSFSCSQAVPMRFDAPYRGISKNTSQGLFASSVGREDDGEDDVNVLSWPMQGLPSLSSQSFQCANLSSYSGGKNLAPLAMGFEGALHSTAGAVKVNDFILHQLSLRNYQRMHHQGDLTYDKHMNSELNNAVYSNATAGAAAARGRSASTMTKTSTSSSTSSVLPPQHLRRGLRPEMLIPPDVVGSNNRGVQTIGKPPLSEAGDNDTKTKANNALRRGNGDDLETEVATFLEQLSKKQPRA